MTEYKFTVKCIKQYTTGGTTIWEKDELYYCSTKDFGSFIVSTSKDKGTSFYELYASLFREFFVISDSLDKLPCIYDWMEDEYKDEVEQTKFFEFLKEDIRRECTTQGFVLSDEVVCEIAYELLYGCEPSDRDCQYIDYVRSKITTERLRQCGKVV